MFDRLEGASQHKVEHSFIEEDREVGHGLVRVEGGEQDVLVAGLA